MNSSPKYFAATNTVVPIKRLFAPGPVQSRYSLELLYSHRSEEFQNLYAETCSRLIEIAGFKNVIMTQGSASSAIETVLSSVLKPTSRLLVLVNGEFARRAIRMASFCTPFIRQVPDVESLLSHLKTGKFDFCFVVQFETSVSIFNETKAIAKCCRLQGVHLITDAVSAFPYYEAPQSKFLITTSAKQLRGLPAMGLIFYNDIIDIDLVDRSDYLNLRKCIDYASMNQTPHTSLIPQMDSLNKSLVEFDVDLRRCQIRMNAMALTAGLEDMVVNDRVCPVVTFAPKEPDKLVRALRQKGISVYQNKFYMNQYVQVGCFNYDTTEAYKEINRLIHCLAQI